jgi:hypothetical protein
VTRRFGIDGEGAVGYEWNGADLLVSYLMPDSAPPPFPPDPDPATAQKGKSLLLRIGAGVCGVIVMIFGISKMITGVQEIRGAGGDKERQQLLVESDRAIDEGNKNVIAAQPVFQGFLNDVDKLGLAAVREREKDKAQSATDLFAKSSEAFQLAGKKLKDAIQRKKEDKMNAFFEAKIKSYELYAQSADLNQEIMSMVLDESIPDMKTLLPKITELASRRDEAQKNAAKISADATESVKKAK